MAEVVVQSERPPAPGAPKRSRRPPDRYPGARLTASGVYNSVYSHCHGPDGMGSTFGPSLIDELSDIDTFRRTVREGRSSGASRLRRSPAIRRSSHTWTTSMPIFKRADTRGTNLLNDKVTFVTSGIATAAGPPAVPELSTGAMMLLGFAGLGSYAAAAKRTEAVSPDFERPLRRAAQGNRARRRRSS
jgi:hypothetical protein